MSLTRTWACVNTQYNFATLFIFKEILLKQCVTNKERGEGEHFCVQYVHDQLLKKDFCSGTSNIRVSKSNREEFEKGWPKIKA